MCPALEYTYLLVHMHYQSDAVATFLWCKYCSVCISCMCYLLKLKIILIEKQDKFCEIVTYAQWLQFSLCSYWTITAWSLMCDSQTLKWNILPPTWGFPEAVLCHDLKNHSLNTDVKHFYKISALLIQKYSFLNRTYMQVWKKCFNKYKIQVFCNCYIFYDVY